MKEIFTEDNPRMFWVPSISPSSLLFYTGDKFPRWKDNMLVGSLNGLSIQRVAFNQPSQAERREPLLRAINLRFRDVAQGPDGFLYVATELGSGGQAADGTTRPWTVTIKQSYATDVELVDAVCLENEKSVARMMNSPN